MKQRVQGGPFHKSGDPLLRHRRAFHFDQSYDLDGYGDGVPPPSPGTVDDYLDRAIYGGPLFDHFGHFVMESTARLWALSDLPKAFAEAPVVFKAGPLLRAHKPDEDFAPAMLEMLERLGVPQRRLHATEGVTQVAQLLVPEQASGIRLPVHPDLQDYLARSFAVPAPGYQQDQTQEGAKYLYVSRQDFRFRGNFLGEAVFAHYLAEAGFRIMEPQHYSLDEQLAAYRAADHIVFNEGSAAHALLLAGRIDATIHHLERRNWHSFEMQYWSQGLTFEHYRPSLRFPDLAGQRNWQMVVFDVHRLLIAVRNRAGIRIKVPSEEVIKAALVDEMRALKKRYSREPSLLPGAMDALRTQLEDSEKFRYLLQGLED